MKRQIIKIDETKCNGCGVCIPNCPEGAIQMIDEKARLISDLFCDGLGACIGECPQGAIFIEEREAEPYNESRVMLENIIPKGMNTIKAHLKHLKEHGETKLLREAQEILKEKKLTVDTNDDEGKLPCGCPGTMAKTLKKNESSSESRCRIQSELSQWPIQLKLINPSVSYLDNADLLIAADCTAFAHGDFHRDFIRGRITIIFCPKLDQNIDIYIDKLAEIFRNKTIKSITIARMEVPCCGGTEVIVKKALEQVEKIIPTNTKIVKIG
jgi:NAD-dependent dihydropyrimidine dehydrogenase PreA subunit